uniref:Ig-like domain-containing protein n=1 Tax=Trichogramma kaykai TaxID=54128 RepID=A0ABD2W362_9HYME
MRIAVPVRGGSGSVGSSEAWLKSSKHAEYGTEIQLPCILKLPQCIGLHSIKWYQGNERIFVYSAEGEMTLANDEVASRMSMVVPKNNMTKSYLKISNLTLEDEALYKCEVTYLAVNRECNNVQHITLNITVQPTSVRVIDESTKQTLEDGRVLGPVIEGSPIALRCESGKGRPVPIVEWYNGNVRLKSESSSELEEHEIGTGSGTLNLVVARSELGATFTCKVSSLALAEPLKIDIKLDVHVRPMKMDIKGVVGHAIQGSKVLLQCEVQGARPPANVTWYNGTEILLQNNSRLDMHETKLTENSDGTTQTNSFLAFTASEYDNGRKFSCAALNSVMLKEGSKPMKQTVTIEVMYPPIIRVSPSNITVNETDDFQLFCDYEANPATLINVIWQRDSKNIMVNEGRYEGGTTDMTSLLVKNASAGDIGRYTCILENDFGSSTSQDFIDVSVLYRPVVEVTIEPSRPINEESRMNVSLSCDVLGGRPAYLTAVRWYLDGDLLKELPDCARNNSVPEEFCDIDPSKLLLESVGRTFHGNYSCEGRNDAGWGPMSADTPVVVYYKPGPASISYEPRKVVKKGPLNITCSVKDPGRPAATGFKWFRGAVRLSEENQAVYRVDKVRLENRENFTCLAYNQAGDGDSATTFINVSAPPAFIKKPPQLVGFVYNATNVSLGCHVECSPLCDIIWMRNNKTIDFSRTRQFYLQNNRSPPNLRTDDFESINSSLVWNLTAWPLGQLDRVADNDVTFTCMSNSNGIGPGVVSTVKIEIYFPPESLTISKKIINVAVDNIPEPIMCNATARPDPQYRWYREGKSEIISEGPVLHFKTPFSRNSRGAYICQANNKIGSATISTYINVQYKPECQVDKEVMEGKDYVVCSAEGNPSEYGFKWSLKSDNDTIESVPIVLSGRSYLPLDDSVSNPRTYVCVANNSIGFSNPCERHVPASVPWWLKLDSDFLVILIATTVIIILVLIVISVVIFLMCRRKHSKLKYNTRVVELEEREHPDGGPPSPTVSSVHSSATISTQQQQQPPVPRWPLKPGVLVHINRTNSMRSGLSPRLGNGSISVGLPSPPLSTTSSSSRLRLSGVTGDSSTTPLTESSNGGPMPFRRAIKDPESRTRRQRRRVNCAANGHQNGAMLQHQDEGVLARANRIRAIFSVQLKDTADGFPGISRGKTAVTYKRIAPRRSEHQQQQQQQQRQQHKQKQSSPQTKLGQTRNNAATTTSSNSTPSSSSASRKRKKPGADPSQAVNSNHMDSISEGLSEPETKTFYENLPFHGIQSPPNKTATIYDYKDHYQQQQQLHQHQHQQPQQQQPQELHQYGYSLASNSSSQITLPLTRSLYHSSSAVSPLQNSYVHNNANSRLSLSNHSPQEQQTAQPQHLSHHHLSNTSTLPFSLLQQQHMQQNSNSSDPQQQQQHHDAMPDLATYDRQASRRHYRRKQRSKHERNKKQHQQRLTNETSFERAQQLGMPESHKISYPHYYEDTCTTTTTTASNGFICDNLDPRYDCATLSDNDYVPAQQAQPQQQYNSLTATRPNKSSSKRYSFSFSELKIAELHFRDVGQEINV